MFKKKIKFIIVFMILKEIQGLNTENEVNGPKPNEDSSTKMIKERRIIEKVSRNAEQKDTTLQEIKEESTSKLTKKTVVHEVGGDQTSTAQILEQKPKFVEIISINTQKKRKMIEKKCAYVKSRKYSSILLQLCSQKFTNMAMDYQLMWINSDDSEGNFMQQDFKDVLKSKAIKANSEENNRLDHPTKFAKPGIYSDENRVNDKNFNSQSRYLDKIDPINMQIRPSMLDNNINTNLNVIRPYEPQENGGKENSFGGNKNYSTSDLSKFSQYNNRDKDVFPKNQFKPNIDLKINGFNNLPIYQNVPNQLDDSQTKYQMNELNINNNPVKPNLQTNNKMLPQQKLDLKPNFSLLNNAISGNGAVKYELNSNKVTSKVNIDVDHNRLPFLEDNKQNINNKEEVQNKTVDEEYTLTMTIAQNEKGNTGNSDNRVSESKMAPSQKKRSTIQYGDTKVREVQIDKLQNADGLIDTNFIHLKSAGTEVEITTNMVEDEKSSEKKYMQIKKNIQTETNSPEETSTGSYLEKIIHEKITEQLKAQNGDVSNDETTTISGSRGDGIASDNDNLGTDITQTSISKDFSETQNENNNNSEDNNIEITTNENIVDNTTNENTVNNNIQSTEDITTQTENIENLDRNKEEGVTNSVLQEGTGVSQDETTSQSSDLNTDTITDSATGQINENTEGTEQDPDIQQTTVDNGIVQEDSNQTQNTPRYGDQKTDQEGNTLEISSDMSDSTNIETTDQYSTLETTVGVDPNNDQVTSETGLENQNAETTYQLEVTTQDGQGTGNETGNSESDLNTQDSSVTEKESDSTTNGTNKEEETVQKDQEQSSDVPSTIIPSDSNNDQSVNIKEDETSQNPDPKSNGESNLTTNGSNKEEVTAQKDQEQNSDVPRTIIPSDSNNDQSVNIKEDETSQNPDTDSNVESDIKEPTVQQDILSEQESKTSPVNSGAPLTSQPDLNTPDKATKSTVPPGKPGYSRYVPSYVQSPNDLGAPLTSQTDLNTPDKATIDTVPQGKSEGSKYVPSYVQPTNNLLPNDLFSTAKSVTTLSPDSLKNIETKTMDYSEFTTLKNESRQRFQTSDTKETSISTEKKDNKETEVVGDISTILVLGTSPKKVPDNEPDKYQIDVENTKKKSNNVVKGALEVTLKPDTESTNINSENNTNKVKDVPQKLLVVPQRFDDSVLTDGKVITDERTKLDTLRTEDLQTPVNIESMKTDLEINNPKKNIEILSNGNIEGAQQSNQQTNMKPNSDISTNSNLEGNIKLDSNIKPIKMKSLNGLLLDDTAKNEDLIKDSDDKNNFLATKLVSDVETVTPIKTSDQEQKYIIQDGKYYGPDKNSPYFKYNWGNPNWGNANINWNSPMNWGNYNGKADTTTTTTTSTTTTTTSTMKTPVTANKYVYGKWSWI